MWSVKSILYSWSLNCVLKLLNSLSILTIQNPVVYINTKRGIAWNHDLVDVVVVEFNTYLKFLFYFTDRVLSKHDCWFCFIKLFFNAMAKVKWLFGHSVNITALPKIDRSFVLKNMQYHCYCPINSQLQHAFRNSFQPQTVQHFLQAQQKR